MSYKKVSAFAKDLGLTPRRLHQLIKKGVLRGQPLFEGGEICISTEEQERFKKLSRKSGRPKGAKNGPRTQI